MSREYKMIAGYLAGGLLVLVLMPALLCAVTGLLDRAVRVEIIRDAGLRWLCIVCLFVAGLAYGIWAVIVQNTRGEGGPLQIGGIELSPKTRKVVVSGPYQYSRNPMLFGTFLVHLAFALYLDLLTAFVLVCALLVFMLIVVVKMEERRLAKDFGAAYAEYQKQVSWFIPWFPHKRS